MGGSADRAANRRPPCGRCRHPRPMSAASSIRLACGLARSASFASRRSKARCPSDPCGAFTRSHPRTARHGRMICRARRGCFRRPSPSQALAELPDAPPRLLRLAQHPPPHGESGRPRAHPWRMVAERRRDAACSATTTASRPSMASASGCFATASPKAAGAGGCMAWAKHELRRTSGHDAFLVPARRIERRRAVLGRGAARHLRRSASSIAIRSPASCARMKPPK